jgi:hypothetical protein
MSNNPERDHPLDSATEEIVDLEQFAKEKKQPPLGRRYRIRIDRTHYVVNSPYITGRELLTLAGKTPVERFMISQKFCGGETKPIKLDQKVDLTTPGIERFMTLPLDQTEGQESFRRDFPLLPDDQAFLDQLGVGWEAIQAGHQRLVVIHNYPVPQGYNHSTVSAAVILEASYPDVQIDMVFFKPALSRVDGKSINNLTNQPLAGESWQQWSRHRTGQNPWRPGIDNLETHFLLVQYWLCREFETARAA